MAITNLLLAGKAVVGEPAPLTDGQVAPLPLNTDGRLRVASKPGYFPPTVGDLTSIGNNLVVDVTDASNINLHLKNVGTATMSAGTFVFEGSIDSTDGTDGTWFAIQVVRTNSNTIEVQTPTLSVAAGAGTAYAWEASVNAIRWMRIRTSAAVTASSIARWTIIRGTYATEPTPAIQTHAVTGSGNFSVVPAAVTTVNTVSAATTNATATRTVAATLTEMTVFNPTAALIYVKLYNKASAPTVGTDVPVFTVPVGVNANFQHEFGQMGKRFSLGIAYAITAGPLATDTAVVAAGAQISLSYV